MDEKKDKLRRMVTSVRLTDAQTEDLRGWAYSQHCTKQDIMDKMFDLFEKEHGTSHRSWK